MGFTCLYIILLIHGHHLAAVNGGVVVLIQFAGECPGIEFASYRKVIRHAQVAFHFCIAGNGQGTANGSFASGCQDTGLDISGFHCAGSLDKTVACIDITSVGTKCPTLGIDVSATSLNKTSIGFNVAVHAQVASHFCIALNGQVASGCHTGDIYYEFTIAYVQSTACFYISGSVQICHLCFGFLYIISFYVFFRRIGLHNGISNTILGGFDCACYVVYGDSFRITNILSHRNHIALIVDNDISNIRRFTQYAASCE